MGIFQNHLMAAGATGGAEFMTATGGTITTDGDYKVHSFTSSGTFTVTEIGASGGAGDQVQYLVIAGGAGGGYSMNGGGGAGGYRTATGFTVAQQAYTITVGAGGAAGTSDSPATAPNGSNSVFSTITSTGGGGGAQTNGGTGASGGSGGGGGGKTSGS